MARPTGSPTPSPGGNTYRPSADRVGGGVSSTMLDRWTQNNIATDQGRNAVNSVNSAQQGQSSTGKYVVYGDNGTRYYSDFPQPTVPVGFQFNNPLYGSGLPSYLSGNQTYVGNRDVVIPMAQEFIYNFTPEQSEMLYQATANTLGYDPGRSRDRLFSTWNSLVDEARVNQVDPFYLLSLRANGTELYPFVELSESSSGGGGGGGVGGPSTSIVRTTQITTPDGAKRLVNQAMTSFLGREATKDEIDAFTKLLNEEERANPTVQTMTSTPSGSVMEQSQTIEGGFDQAQFTADYAQSRPDYAEYRAATDLMGAFMSIIDGPV